MSIATQHPDQTYGARPGPVETPFLEMYEGPTGTEQEASPESWAPETPFLSEYRLGEDVISESGGAFSELLSQLYDSEFDEALLELADEADAHAHLLGLGETGADLARLEPALEEWIAPLRHEAEALLEAIGDALDETDPQAMSEPELDELLDQFEPAGTNLAPAFEDFLKGLVKKARNAVKGAVNLAKKGVAAVGKLLPIGAILKKLKVLVRPLLRKVLKLAMNRLPPSLRPVAAQLAKRYIGAAEAPDQEVDEAAGNPAPASPDVGALQLDFDAGVASALLAPGEAEQDAFLAEAVLEAERVDDASLAELDRARDEFVEGLQRLEEGEDPTPLVEQFIPAILPVLRMGIGLIGRRRVVGFLARYLGRLIAPYVGRQLTPPLSRAIVDAGLGLMTLEAPDQEGGADQQPVAAEAFASLIEDTIARVAELDESELEEPNLLEGATYEAVEQLARFSFPPAVLRGAAGAGRPAGTWVTMPRRGRKRYRKYSRVLDVTVTPAMAEAILTRGGRSLATFLRSRHATAGPVRARIHLYQAIPGTRLARIAHAERAVGGLGPGVRRPDAEFHPLTREAAAVLAGDPELGTDAAARAEYEDEAAPPAVGERFYYLEIPGGRPTATVGSTRDGQQGPPRASAVTAAVDVAQRHLTFALYLSETQAQAIAVRLRRRQPLGPVLAALRGIYAPGVRSLLGGARRSRIRIVGEVEGEEFLGLPGLQPPSGWIEKLLTRWLGLALASELERHRATFVATADAPADGLTLTVRIDQVPGLAAVAQLMRRRLPSASSALAALRDLERFRPGRVTLRINPGYQRA